jgi:hypothetical protein
MVMQYLLVLAQLKLLAHVNSLAFMNTDFLGLTALSLLYLYLYPFQPF